MTVPSNEMNKLDAAPGLTEQEAAFVLDVFQQPATKLDVVVGVWTVPEELGLVWPVGTYKWVSQASLRARLMQALTAAPAAPQSAKISTWRERIGQAADFPLHVPTDVERAMVAEIAELRAAAPVVCTITLTGHQLVAALDLLAPGLPRDPEELDGDLTFGVVQHKDDDGAVATGTCCWNDDTDGVLPLDEHPDPAATIQEPVMVAAPVGVLAEKWAIYYDNLGEQSYPSRYMQDWKLYESEDDANAHIAPLTHAKHYSARKVQIVAPMVADPAGVSRRATDAEVAAWAERYNIGNMLSGEARAAFEDAESLHMTYAATVKSIPSEALEHAQQMQEARKIISALSLSLEAFMTAYDEGDAPDSEQEAALQAAATDAYKWLITDVKACMVRDKLIRDAAPLAGKTGGAA